MVTMLFTRAADPTRSRAARAKTLFMARPEMIISMAARAMIA